MADQQQPQQQEMNVVRASGLELPPGFRFHPTDDEIVSYYLANKVRNTDYTCIAIGEVDLKKIEPWDLPDEAKWGEKEWYFFYKKDHKYPTGLRANRATKTGHWKATGRDKEVYNTTKGVVLLVGMKKTLVFYEGRAPWGNKTNWVMHEYRLEGNGKLLGPASASSSIANATATIDASTSSDKNEWVVCRVFDKTTRIKKTIAPVYQVAIASAEIDQNQNNTLTIPIPMPLQLPLPAPIAMQFPILPDFTIDPVAPYYPNGGVGMSSMAGIGGADGLEINGAMFDNPMAVPPPMNFHHQMDMGAVAGQMGMEAIAGHMDMGAASVGGFDVGALESRPSSMVSQKDEQANATEISSMMSMTCPWKY